MGQGVHTVLRQMLCEELGLDPAQITVEVDTCYELGCGQTTASRGTVLGGRAVIDAAAKLRADMAGRDLADLAGRGIAAKPASTGPLP